MANFDEHDPVSVIKFVVRNVPRHKQFALSTISEDGSPWTVCVNLSVDDNLNFIWKSQTNTEHSKHIHADPRVAICVFSETEDIGDFGLYCKAIAHEVTDENELKKLLEIREVLKGKPMPPLSDFLGPAPARIYFAEVQTAWVNDNRHLKAAIDLDTLREMTK